MFVKIGNKTTDYSFFLKRRRKNLEEKIQCSANDTNKTEEDKKSIAS